MPPCALRTERYGPASDPAPCHRLSAPDGSGVRVIETGAAWVEVLVPDREGRLANVTLAHRAPRAYRTNRAYLGAVVGRTAGRIGGARYELDGRRVALPANEGRHHLHGGPDGWHRRRWRTVARGSDASSAWVEMALASPDGDQGHPGRAEVRVRYAWTVRHELLVHIRVRADAPLIANPTHHATWNLAGEGRGSVHGHRLSVAADAVAETASDRVATGRRRSLDGSSLDLRRPRTIGSVVPDAPPLAAFPGDVDHAFLLEDGGVEGVPGLAREAAFLEEPASGRTLTVRTGEPCLQVYTGSGLDGSAVGPSGAPYPRGAGVALEPQRLPLAFDPDGWTVRPGEERSWSAAFAFGVAGPRR